MKKKTIAIGLILFILFIITLFVTKTNIFSIASKNMNDI